MNDISDGSTATLQDESLSAVSRKEYAVTVRHAHIQYKDVLGALASGGSPTTTVVLKDFNMTVEKGHIYGLLGASGCGKTSLLRAIVGQLELTAGEIKVLGHRPTTPESGIPGTTVGYMPQELSLLGEFTIRESLYFYGKLGGMSTEEIDDKCDYFTKFLELPKPNRIVSTLSGGQKRRVSFAIALLHSPPILILDEPTVGVDPLLRENIWEYMCKISKTNRTTVLITTHYIEEARQADMVGLMRHGKLMAEEHPFSLMQSLQCAGLEDVLLKLCVLQSSNQRPISSVNDTSDLLTLPKVNEDDVMTEPTTWTKKEVSSMQRLKVLAWKDSISIMRHFWFLLMYWFFPAMCTAIMCVAFGGTPKDVQISVFNQETNCFMSGLSSTNPYVTENITDCTKPSLLSCRVLGLLQDKGVLLLASDSEMSAVNDVRRGWSWAALTFTKNFTESMMERAYYASPVDVDNNVVDTGKVQVLMDESDRIISISIQDRIVTSLKEALNEVDGVCHNVRHMKDIPMQFKTPIYGGPSKTAFTDFGLPGTLTSLAFMIPLTGTLSIMLPEKIQGTMERGLVVGVQMSEVIMANFLVVVVPTLGVAAEILLIPFVIFGNTLFGSFWSLAFVMIPLAISGMLVGVILTIVCSTMTSASLLGMGFYFTCLLTSGTIWPVEGVHPLLRPFCWALPLTFSTEAVRHITLRGWTVYNKSLQTALASTILWSFVFIVTIRLLLRFKR